MTVILRRTLATERRSMVGWVLGLALLGVITAGTWPAVRDAGEEFSAALQNLPQALTAFLGEGLTDFSAAGLVGSRQFGSIGMAVMIGFAISRGARAVAGEEGNGTLELLVTQPLSRAAVAVAKVLSTLLALALLVLAQMGLLLAMMPVVGLDFAVADVIGASAGLYCLAGMFGMVSFAVGAATGNRGSAVGVAAGLAAALFVLSGLGVLVEGLAPVADLSPFHLYDGSTVLADGVNVTAVSVFAALAVALVVGGILAFERRDLS
ncbi:MAG: ABC transporter permease subunit [Euzebya sp.]